jgi:arylsulfatase A-like enzyme
MHSRCARRPRGKWHLGHADRKYWPRQRGFDCQYGPLLGEIDYFTHSAHGTRDWFRNNQRVKDQGYATHLLGKDTTKLIDSRDPATPLFLYLAFTAPHAPCQAPKEYLDQDAHIADRARRAYAAMIAAMDAEIGRVLGALEKRRIRENTLVVFESDNGGPRSAKFTGKVNMSKSTIPADNGPYRDGKGTLYEGGTTRRREAPAIRVRRLAWRGAGSREAALRGAHGYRAESRGVALKGVPGRVPVGTRRRCT